MSIRLVVLQRTHGSKIVLLEKNGVQLAAATAVCMMLLKEFRFFLGNFLFYDDDDVHGAVAPRFTTTKTRSTRQGSTQTTQEKEKAKNRSERNATRIFFASVL